MGMGTTTKGMAMPHFMIQCDYTSAAFNKMMDNPNTNRFEAVNKMAAAAGAKVVCMFAKGDTGPGVVIIVEGPSEAALPMASLPQPLSRVQTMNFPPSFPPH